ncbi:hypothetical protein [Streptomyces sp. NPDC048269]|uniref:hypothetical protein n=1 Tax=Streptomyces sp. NPDC048269 TaxID=3155753 RepID=UPI003430D81B
MAARPRTHTLTAGSSDWSAAAAAIRYQRTAAAPWGPGEGFRVQGHQPGGGGPQAGLLQLLLHDDEFARTAALDVGRAHRHVGAVPPI